MLLTLIALQAAVAAVPIDDVRCRPGAGPAVLVRVAGFKTRTGKVRVRLFGGATSTYFDKKKALVRIERPVPRTGRADVCVPVPRPGLYAVDVRHDLDGDGKTGRRDGGGASGNPSIGLLDVLLSRKPDPRRVQVGVGTGTTVVPVTLMYLDGGSFKPAKSAD